MRASAGKGCNSEVVHPQDRSRLPRIWCCVPRRVVLLPGELPGGYSPVPPPPKTRAAFLNIHRFAPRKTCGSRAKTTDGDALSRLCVYFREANRCVDVLRYLATDSFIFYLFFSGRMPGSRHQEVYIRPPAARTAVYQIERPRETCPFIQ